MEPVPPRDPPVPTDSPQRAFVKPSPGGRGGVPRSAMSGLGGADFGDLSSPDQGLNPLVALANPLLMLAPALRATRAVPDLSELRESLVTGVRGFEARATAQGIATERVLAARYVLCAVLDEAAAGTPWGGLGQWASHSLLALFHSETDGGDRVFQLMARLAEKPDQNLDLLELIYCAITLGFEGRYRSLSEGRTQLDAIRDRLARIVQTQRGEHAHALALHWRGRTVASQATRSLLPLAVTTALCALLLIGTYGAMSLSLRNGAEAAYGAIQALRLAPPTSLLAQPAAVPRLAPYLQSDITGGVLTVRDEVSRSVVTLRADSLFAADRATLLPEREATLSRLADALGHLPGRVLVTAHTDDQPLAPQTGAPSRWHFTEDRAKRVRDALLDHGIAADRVGAEGRADAEPLVANDTVGNRAINRRVEITLLVAAGAPAQTSGR